jgi:ATP-dependent helicase/nuclease subunit A
MTVHRSKGLEFPVVVLPDLGRNPLNRTETLLLRGEGGLALKLRGESSEREPTSAYRIAQRAEQRAERAERQRLLYVALTRAQDYLMLSGTPGKGEDWLSLLAATLDIGSTIEHNQGLQVTTH